MIYEIKINIGFESTIDLYKSVAYFTTLDKAIDYLKTRRGEDFSDECGEPVTLWIEEHNIDVFKETDSKTVAYVKYENPYYDCDDDVIPDDKPIITLK